MVGTSIGPMSNLEGLDLHTSLVVPADDRARLEQFCRYLLRPHVV